MVTLSGPSAVLGMQVRDGFQLALQGLGGEMAGRQVELTLLDDELKPDLAAQKIQSLLARGQVDLVVGPILCHCAVPSVLTAMAIPFRIFIR